MEATDTEVATVLADVTQRSFKAGKQKGREDVVGCSNEICPHDIQELFQSGLCTHNDMPEKKCECPLCWQAKLKEWGIE